MELLHSAKPCINLPRCTNQPFSWYVRYGHGFEMCIKAMCKGPDCSYAHSRAENISWNHQLHQLRSAGQKRYSLKRPHPLSISPTYNQKKTRQEESAMDMLQPQLAVVIDQLKSQQVNQQVEISRLQHSILPILPSKCIPSL